MTILEQLDNQLNETMNPETDDCQELESVFCAVKIYFSEIGHVMAVACKGDPISDILTKRIHGHISEFATGIRDEIMALTTLRDIAYAMPKQKVKEVRDLLENNDFAQAKKVIRDFAKTLSDDFTISETEETGA